MTNFSFSSLTFNNFVATNQNLSTKSEIILIELMTNENTYFWLSFINISANRIKLLAEFFSL